VTVGEAEVVVETTRILLDVRGIRGRKGTAVEVADRTTGAATTAGK